MPRPIGCRTWEGQGNSSKAYWTALSWVPVGWIKIYEILMSHIAVLLKPFFFLKPILDTSHGLLFSKCLGVSSLGFVLPRLCMLLVWSLVWYHVFPQFLPSRYFLKPSTIIWLSTCSSLQRLRSKQQAEKFPGRVQTGKLNSKRGRTKNKESKWTNFYANSWASIRVWAESVSIIHPVSDPWFWSDAAMKVDEIWSRYKMR